MYTIIKTILFPINESGAIADTVYEALKMVINGITTLINGIGHLLTNLVKRLCQLLDQLTKPRWKRSTMSTFGNQEEGTWKLIRFFFQVIGNILSIITYPLRSIFALVTSLFPLIYGSFGDRNSTSSFMPTDLNIRNIRDMLVRDIWYFVKQNVIPQLDIVATKLIESNMIPNNLKTILSNFHGVHNLLKMLDYVR